MHLICDGQGLPLAVTISPGQEHETQQFLSLMEEIEAWDNYPDKLAGDMGYSANWIRDWLKERGIKPVIPYKCNETSTERLERKSYRRRNIIERCVSNLKWFRRVATRYEKLAVHYLGMLKLAIIFRHL